MVLKLLCETKKYEILKIKIINNRIISLKTLWLKYTDLRWKSFRITIFYNTQRHIPFSVPFCVCAEEQTSVLLLWVVSVRASHVQMPQAVSYWRISTFFGGMYFSSVVSITQARKAYLCVQQFIRFFIHHLLRSCTVPFTFAVVLPDCCELISAVEFS